MIKVCVPLNRFSYKYGVYERISFNMKYDKFYTFKLLDENLHKLGKTAKI